VLTNGSSPGGSRWKTTSVGVRVVEDCKNKDKKIKIICDKK